jgi:site-specific DNA-methyltransferase (adenine-specific)
MRERVDDDSVDCVITDPPYGFDYQNTSHAEQDFDSLANFDDWSLFENTLDEFHRVLKPSGHVYVWWGWQFYGRMEKMFRQRFEHVDTLVWVKNNFGLNGHSRDRYRPQYEVCFHGTLGDEARPLNDANTLSDVLEFDKDGGAEYDHPTQKPAPLISDLITDCTSKGSVVLDAFMGSGTTAVAAIQNDRDYVGFEIDADNYRDVIERRIGEAKRQREAGVNQDD